MSNILEKCKIIEDGIQKLGINPATTRGKNTGEWDFVRGSAKIAVGINQSKKYPDGIFYVICSIIKIDQIPHEKRFGLLQALMEENLKLVEMKFCMDKSNIFLLANRDIKGLDSVEVGNSINQLSYYADTFDDMIINRFSR